MTYSFFMCEIDVLHACSILHLMVIKCVSSLHDLKLFIDNLQCIVHPCTQHTLLW